MRAKYGTEYKGDYRIDGGGTTRPLSTQRRNCLPACRRPFPACSTALCVWLLAVQAAAARSARVPPPRALLMSCRRTLCFRVPLGALSSSLHVPCQCFGLTHDHACSCASGCTGRSATMQLPAAKTAMRTRRESRRPWPHLFLRPFTFISCFTRHNKHTHDDTNREDIQRFQWRSLWLQWRSQRPPTTTAGSSPCIT